MRPQRFISVCILGRLLTVSQGFVLQTGKDVQFSRGIHLAGANGDHQGDEPYPNSLEEWQKKYPDPFAAGGSRPSKADVYSNEDLQNLWDLHQDISQSMPKPEEQPPATDIPSLHDFVLETLKDIDGPGKPLEIIVDEENALSPEIREKLQNIRAIASDVDGTLLTTDHTVHPRTFAAIKEAVAAASTGETIEHFFLATGKTRSGALTSLGPELQGLLSQVPGVYVQGLYCVDVSGKVVYERRLNDESVRAAVAFARQHDFTLLGYHGDALYASENSKPHHVLEAHERFGEPLPIALDSDEAFINFQGGWNKVLFMDDDIDTLKTVFRPLLDDLAEKHDASTTQAVPNMLELLPAGCSKEQGVQQLCMELGIDPGTELLAVGDGENDAGLLDMAAVGVAVGNAVDYTKSKSDIVLRETNNEGGAGVAIDQYGLKKILER